MEFTVKETPRDVPLSSIKVGQGFRNEYGDTFIRVLLDVNVKTPRTGVFALDHRGCVSLYTESESANSIMVEPIDIEVTT